MQREAASYRDPEGYIIYEDGEVYRCVTDDDAAMCQDKFQPFFKEAVECGLLVPFECAGQKNNAHLFKLEKLPVVSYPYEWGFMQLKQAALLTLDVTLLALEHGLTLKDATAFNVQPYKGGMIFIDHTSFASSDNKMPWRPYSQFCKHFLAPLLMASRTGRHINKFFRLNLDGVDLGEAVSALPFRDALNPAVLIHIHAHHFMSKSFEHSNDTQKEIKRSGNQRAYIEHLKKVITAIKPPRYATEWGDYYANTNYQDADFQEKERIIKTLIGDACYDCVWDMGANNGHFSRLVSDQADQVISMDIDHAAVDFNVSENMRRNISNIYPLVMDLTNPSPALGFGNRERLTIGERSQPNLILALALIHHLSITYNVPFSTIAEHLQSYNADLIIEFVGREDSQTKRLLCNKDDPYEHYNKEAFESAFGACFKLDRQEDVKDMNRTIYYMRPKAGN